MVWKFKKQTSTPLVLDQIKFSLTPLLKINQVEFLKSLKMIKIITKKNDFVG